MIELLTADQVKATPHHVVGGNEGRISVPLFFNPAHDTNMAPPDSGDVVLAGDHLSRRFKETYLHFKNG
ncbi:MAG: isopenicillin N synthase-like dioxygenase [Candidatus Azotimanducaceae bacterium]|jgi:isopenicillin N synthase-like dioxygenase